MIPLEDLHGRGLFDDHVRDAAVHRCVVGGRESKGRADVCRKQSHSTNVGEVGEDAIKHHHHHHHYHHQTLERWVRKSCLVRTIASTELVEQVKNITYGSRTDMKVIGLGNITGAEEA